MATKNEGQKIGRNGKTGGAGVHSGGGWDGVRWSDGGLSGCIGVCGQPGTGKSFLVAQLLKRCRRVLIVDTTATYGNGPRQTPLPGYVFFDQPGQLVNYWRRARHGSFHICYVPGQDELQHLDAVLRLAWEVRDTVIFVDEVWQYGSASVCPEVLRAAARAGRRRGITLIWAAQVLPDVPLSLRKLTTSWYVFRVSGEECENLRLRLPDAALAVVPTLPDRWHIFRDERGNWEKRGPSK